MMAVFYSTFAMPYLVYLFAGLDKTTNQMLLSTAMMGWSSLYSLELIAIGVEGIESYLRDPWNYLD